MKKNLSLMLFAFLLLLGSCSKSATNSNSSGTNTPSPNTVNISGMSFPAITVKAGSTVTWMNMDAMAHTVTADDNSFTSTNLAHGDVFSYTFPTAGSYNYHCKIHAGMSGTVTVQ